MKVLQMFGEPVSHGGQEAFVINLIKHIPNNNISFDVLTPYYCDNNYYRDIITARGGNVYALGLSFNPGKSRLNIVKPVTKFFEEHKYDIVHIHSGSTSVLAEGSKLANDAGIKKIIVHSHCAADKKDLKYHFVRIITRFALNKFPTHYAACSLLAGESKFSKDIVKNKLVILKNGIDLNEFSFNTESRDVMRTKLGFAKDCLVLGHVGRFSYQKNQEYIIEILRDLLLKGVNAKILFVGTGETFENVINLSRKYDISQRIVFAGNINNVADYMRAMDVFILPSRFEGMPIVAVEAQAIGLPCIFSDNITREADLTNNVCYLPVQSTDVGLWAEQCINFSNCYGADNKELLMHEGFDINSTAETVVRLYKG